MKKFNKILRLQGFSLAELLIATVILTLAFVGIILTFIRCMQLSELSRNSSIAVSAIKSQAEQISNAPFTEIFTTYNNATFTVAGLNGIGVCYVNNADPNLLQITISFCWQQKSGRIIGEDLDLDGVLDAGEDQNGNGMIDSIVQLTTSKFNE